jgi:hypothetical protein
MLRSAAIHAARRSPVLVAGATLLTAAAVCHGSEPGYQVSVGVIESDNIQRLSSGGNTDTIIEEELGLTWHQRGARLDADVDADLSHLNYVPAIFGDEVIGNFIGQARYAVVKQMLFWELADNFGQSSINPLQAITPTNREFVNYAMTGPEMLLPLGGSTLLDVTARYGRVDYQTSALNSNRFSGGLGVIHNLSPLSHVSLNVRDERVDYTNDTLNPDYDNQEAFVRSATSSRIRPPAFGSSSRSAARTSMPRRSPPRERLSPVSMAPCRGISHAIARAGALRLRFTRITICKATRSMISAPRSTRTYRAR